MPGAIWACCFSPEEAKQEAQADARPRESPVVVSLLPPQNPPPNQHDPAAENQKIAAFLTALSSNSNHAGWLERMQGTTLQLLQLLDAQMVCITALAPGRNSYITLAAEGLGLEHLNVGIPMPTLTVVGGGATTAAAAVAAAGSATTTSREPGSRVSSNFQSTGTVSWKDLPSSSAPQRLSSSGREQQGASSSMRKDSSSTLLSTQHRDGLRPSLGNSDNPSTGPQQHAPGSSGRQAGSPGAGTPLQLAVIQPSPMPTPAPPPVGTSLQILFATEAATSVHAEVEHARDSSSSSKSRAHPGGSSASSAATAPMQPSPFANGQGGSEALKLHTDWPEDWRQLVALYPSQLSRFTALPIYRGDVVVGAVTVAYGPTQTHPSAPSTAVASNQSGTRLSGTWPRGSQPQQHVNSSNSIPEYGQAPTLAGGSTDLQHSARFTTGYSTFQQPSLKRAVTGGTEISFGLVGTMPGSGRMGGGSVGDAAGAGVTTGRTAVAVSDARGSGARGLSSHQLPVLAAFLGTALFSAPEVGLVCEYLCDLAGLRDVDSLVRGIARAAVAHAKACVHVAPQCRVALLRSDASAAVVFEEVGVAGLPGGAGHSRHASYASYAPSYAGSDDFSPFRPQAPAAVAGELALRRTRSKRQQQLAAAAAASNAATAAAAAAAAASAAGSSGGWWPHSQTPPNTIGTERGSAVAADRQRSQDLGPKPLPLLPEGQEGGSGGAANAWQPSSGTGEAAGALVQASAGSAAESSTGVAVPAHVPGASGWAGHALLLQNTLLGQAVDRHAGVWVSDCTLYLHNSRNHMSRDILISRSTKNVASLAVTVAFIPTAGRLAIASSSSHAQLHLQMRPPALPLTGGGGMPPPSHIAATALNGGGVPGLGGGGAGRGVPGVLGAPGGGQPERGSLSGAQPLLGVYAVFSTVLPAQLLKAIISVLDSLLQAMLPLVHHKLCGECGEEWRHLHDTLLDPRELVAQMRANAGGADSHAAATPSTSGGTFRTSPNRSRHAQPLSPRRSPANGPTGPPGSAAARDVPAYGPRIRRSDAGATNTRLPRLDGPVGGHAAAMSGPSALISSSGTERGTGLDRSVPRAVGFPSSSIPRHGSSSHRLTAGPALASTPETNPLGHDHPASAAASVPNKPLGPFALPPLPGGGTGAAAASPPPAGVGARAPRAPPPAASYVLDAPVAASNPGRLAPMLAGLHDRLRAMQARLLHERQGSDELSGLELLEQIGAGGYGRVYRGLYNGVEVAVKVTSGVHPGESCELQVVRDAAELAVMTAVAHPCLVPILCFFTDVSLVMREVTPFPQSLAQWQGPLLRTTSKSSPNIAGSPTAAGAGGAGKQQGLSFLASGPSNLGAGGSASKSRSTRSKSGSRSRSSGATGSGAEVALGDNSVVFGAPQLPGVTELPDEEGVQGGGDGDGSSSAEEEAEGGQMEEAGSAMGPSTHGGAGSSGGPSGESVGSKSPGTEGHHGGELTGSSAGAISSQPTEQAVAGGAAARVGAGMQTLGGGASTLQAMRSLSRLELARSESITGPRPVLVLAGEVGDSRVEVAHAMAIVMELCDGGSLADAIRDGAFREPPAADAPLGTTPRPRYPYAYTTLLEVALALRHLHALQLVHCDLKPSNVLLKSSTRDPRGFTAKLGDFGLVKLTVDDGTGRLVIGRDQHTGTVTHMAPEMLRTDVSADASVDIYSFGILMWELVASGPVYAGMAAVAIRDGVRYRGLRPVFAPWVAPEYRDLACECWVDDPDARPTAADLVNRVRKLLVKSGSLASTKARRFSSVAVGAGAGGGGGARAGMGLGAAFYGHAPGGVALDVWGTPGPGGEPGRPHIAAAAKALISPEAAAAISGGTLAAIAAMAGMAGGGAGPEMGMAGGAAGSAFGAGAPVIAPPPPAFRQHASRGGRGHVSTRLSRTSSRHSRSRSADEFTFPLHIL